MALLTTKTRRARTPAPPLPLRELRAQMTLAHLSLRDVSRLSRISYARCSEILGGVRIAPEKLAVIRRVITTAPIPQ